MKPLSTVVITPSSTVINGVAFGFPSGDHSLSALYRALSPAYPKFFKMDGMARLGFLGAELTMRGYPEDSRNDIDIMLFSGTGSIATDRHYQTTIPTDNYFPSPAVFVYTLANIVAGEIAIRHKIHGETSLYMLPDDSDHLMTAMIETHRHAVPCRMLLAGRIDYVGEDDYICRMNLYSPLSAETCQL